MESIQSRLEEIKIESR